jgi:hypothetical protein
MATLSKEADAATGYTSSEAGQDEDNPTVPTVLLYLGYWILTLVLVVCGSVLALYVSALVPGVAGVLVFLTAGVVLPASAPPVAQVLLARSVPGVEIPDGGRGGGNLRRRPQFTRQGSRRPRQSGSTWFRRW